MTMSAGAAPLRLASRKRPLWVLYSTTTSLNRKALGRVSLPSAFAPFRFHFRPSNFWGLLHPARLYFFPCAPARDRFALRRRSLLPKAFAPAATWTRLCLRSSRTGGWLHSRHRETSASPYQKEGTITRPRSEHLIFLSGGRSGRQLRDSRTYAMVLGDLRRCKTAFYRTGHRATIYGAGIVMRRRTAILYRTSAAIFTR